MTDEILYVPAQETILTEPTMSLRFVYKQLSNGSVSRILQQEFSVMTYRDGKPHSRTSEWRDIPCIDGN